MKTLLLTGGTGYIGSHNAVLLLEKDYNVVILDNLSNSSESVVINIEKITGKTPKFYNGDLRNIADLELIFSENTIDAVLHFAGLKSVGESCVEPNNYYENNIIGTMNLLQVMKRYDCLDIIFSSSATVYNPYQTPPFTENTPTGDTTNPYGTSKFIIENILRDLANHKGFRVINLRYFNPVGAHESGFIGEESTSTPNNLLPYIMKVANSELENLHIYGDDYSTIDGTGIRDYIHVVDLASGHYASLKYLERNNDTGGVFEVFNLGTGAGTSVFEMVKISEDITQKRIPYTIELRRSGDIASAYCNPEKAQTILGWEAKKTIQEAIYDSWNFINTRKGK